MEVQGSSAITLFEWGLGAVSGAQGFPSLRRVPFRFPPPATFCFTSGCGAFAAWSHTDTTSPVWCVCTRGWMEDGVECIVVQHFWQHVQGPSIASRVFYRGLAGASQVWQGVCRAIGRRAELPEARRPIWPSTEGSAIHCAFSTTTPKAPKKLPASSAGLTQPLRKTAGPPASAVYCPRRDMRDNCGMPAPAESFWVGLYGKRGGAGPPSTPPRPRRTVEHSQP